MTKRLMDRELKARWLEALRSGKYSKGKSYLCRDNKYCCLGVLAEIENLFDGEYDKLKCIGAEADVTSIAFLPADIAVSYGLMELCVGPSDNTHQIELGQINDRTETFDEVIDYIENNL